MSVNESTESTETLYQTPSAIVLEAGASTHEELDPSVQEELGASPDLSGPLRPCHPVGQEKKELRLCEVIWKEEKQDEPGAFSSWQDGGPISG